MNDATLTWTKSLTGTPTGYAVIWSHNGAAQPGYTVPASAAQDAAGYSQDFATSNPTIAAKPGDTIGATVVAIDAANNLQSAAVPSSPPTVTIPTVPVPPGPPQNVALALS